MKDNFYHCLKEICNNRKSNREFLDKAVPEILLNQIKEIALTSPYASGKKNWGLDIITDKNIFHKIAQSIRRKNEEITNCIRDDFRDGFAKYAENFTFFENAPAVFFLNYRSSASLSLMFENIESENHLEKILEWERDNYVKSISCVAMLILLGAESLELGSCYMTGPLLAEEEIKEILKIKKDRRIGAVIPVGYYK